jgi:hypothetical protein
MARLNDATPSEWNAARDMIKKNQDAIYQEREATKQKTVLEAWMHAAHDEGSELWEDELDAVNNPTHYNTGNIECIEAIEESMSSVAFKGYLKGNCLKYLWRYDYKGKQVEDLQKAGWYLNKLTKMVTEENS